MSRVVSILCFGNSLTAGYHSYGIGYHPYADELERVLREEFSGIEFYPTVEGLAGDLVCWPGSFQSRMKLKCDHARYDWTICLGGTNDLGYGKLAEEIYDGLQKTWQIALDTGCRVIALTVPECKARSRSLDNRRSDLNKMILAHKAERFYTLDLQSRIPYHSSDEKFIENHFDDGLHLTPEGYDFMGRLIAERMIGLLKDQGLAGKTQDVAPVPDSRENINV
ncbi:SGNH hydrolase [Penicillium lividum]|nr:SGNH hydrolase [Penicillium lividum]